MGNGSFFGSPCTHTTYVHKAFINSFAVKEILLQMDIMNTYDNPVQLIPLNIGIDTAIREHNP